MGRRTRHGPGAGGGCCPGRRVSARSILILGGTRFVGRLLVLDLLGRAHRVTVLNRGITPDDLPPEVERLRADRGEPEAVAAAVRGRTFDAVADLSAYRG